MSAEREKAELMKQCRKYFSTLDTNGDGKMDSREFSAMCKEAGACSDLESLKRCYKKADHNGDGLVSFNEFMEAFADDHQQFQPRVNIIDNGKVKLN